MHMLLLTCPLCRHNKHGMQWDYSKPRTRWRVMKLVINSCIHLHNRSILSWCLFFFLLGCEFRSNVHISIFHWQQLKIVKILLSFSVSKAQNTAVCMTCNVPQLWKWSLFHALVLVLCFYPGRYLHKLNAEVFICFHGKKLT